MSEEIKKETVTTTPEHTTEDKKHTEHTEDKKHVEHADTPVVKADEENAA